MNQVINGILVYKAFFSRTAGRAKVPFRYVNNLSLFMISVATENGISVLDFDREHPLSCLIFSTVVVDGNIFRL